MPRSAGDYKQVGETLGRRSVNGDVSEIGSGDGDGVMPEHEPSPTSPDVVHIFGEAKRSSPGEANRSSPPELPHACHRTLTWSSVCFITYFNVCGGPWGSEGVISSAGPLPGLLGMLAMALTFGVPLGLLTSELSSAYPVNGGYSIWVSEAFGPFWGLQESLWSWMSGVVDNAIYPLLTYRAIVLAFGFEEHVVHNFSGFIFRVIIALIYSTPGVFLVRPIGDTLILFFILILLPFLVLAFYSVSTNPVDFGTLGQTNDDISWDNGWGDLLNILYWNFSGLDSASTSAGEVKNPGYHLPRGLLLCVLLTTITYAIPLIAVTVVNVPDYTEWSDGSFATIAKQQGGRWLASWIAVAGVIGNAGMHVAELFEDSWQLHGMAEAGLVPRALRYRHPYFQTPWMCIALQVLIICGMQAFRFEIILVIDNFFSVISVLLEIIAFVYLRYKNPDLPRPYRIPLSNGWATLLLAPMFILGVIVAYAGLTESRVSMYINLGGLTLGVLSSLVMLRTSQSVYIPLNATVHEELQDSTEDIKYAFSSDGSRNALQDSDPEMSIDRLSPDGQSHFPHDKMVSSQGTNISLR